MRKLKRILVLLLAAGIIAVCALLPGMIAAYQDGTSLGQTHYETVPNIQLQIRGEEETPAMAKLAMMARLEGGIEISESLAAMSRVEAEERALAILEEYVAAGLAEDFEPVVLNSRCMLASTAVDPVLNGVFWMVTLVSGDDRQYAQFDLALDDESGLLLAVSYANENPIPQQQREVKLAAFADFYFGSLGIGDYAAFATDDMETQYTGENGCVVRYRFGDTVYGEVNVDLYVHEYGFYTEFPYLVEGHQ